MTEKLVQSKEFIKACKDATIKALAGKVKDEDVKKLLNCMPEEAALTSELGVPSSAEAKLERSLSGYVKCIPTHLDHEFEFNQWFGFSELPVNGTMYTAYDSWEALFSETRRYHAQSIASAGGILQITWFNGDGVPVGQFNAAAGGIAVFEVGGEGRWKKK